VAHVTLHSRIPRYQINITAIFIQAQNHNTSMSSGFCKISLRKLLHLQAFTAAQNALDEC
jgi:hypothetical protein